MPSSPSVSTTMSRPWQRVTEGVDPDPGPSRLVYHCFGMCVLD